MIGDGDERVRLVEDRALEAGSVVANSSMNRERVLRGGNGYVRELGRDPVELLAGRADREDDRRPLRWLDLCCGRGLALAGAADELDAADRPNVRITGLDLVDDFAGEARRRDRVELVSNSIREWEPADRFDLITCVHGLHYVGDKLGALSRIASWLTSEGELVANFDAASVRLRDGRPAGRRLTNALRAAGFHVDTRRRRIGLDGRRQVELPYRYLGADPDAGPNYTGQSAVHSYYEEA